MPLRDHFQRLTGGWPSWGGLYGMWPGMALRQLNEVLPQGFRGGPRIHLGTVKENDDFNRDPELPRQDIYELNIFAEPRRLIAVIHFISPSNKEPLIHRQAFVERMFGRLGDNVSVSIVDLVGVLKINLCTELLRGLGQSDPQFKTDSPAGYTATIRLGDGKSRRMVETWAYPLEIGSSLPTLPIWLDQDHSVPLELEASYSESCRLLRMA